MTEVQVLSGPERRRRWSEEEKRTLVSAAFAPGSVVREVARRADVSASLIYRWRRQFRAADAGFAEMVVVPEGPGGGFMAPRPAIELEVDGRVRMRIAASTAPELAAAVAKAVAGR